MLHFMSISQWLMMIIRCSSATSQKIKKDNLLGWLTYSNLKLSHEIKFKKQIFEKEEKEEEINCIFIMCVVCICVNNDLCTNFMTIRSHILCNFKHINNWSTCFHIKRNQKSFRNN